MQVSKEADTLLRRKCGLDSPKPAVDLEDPALVQSMLQLILGSSGRLQHNAASAPAAVKQTWQHAASHPLQIKLLRQLCCSKAAANALPLTLQVRCGAL